MNLRLRRLEEQIPPPPHPMEESAAVLAPSYLMMQKKQELAKFDSNIRKFVTWKSDWRSAVHLQCSETQEIFEIRKCVSDDMKTNINNLKIIDESWRFPPIVGLPAELEVHQMIKDSLGVA